MKFNWLSLGHTIPCLFYTGHIFGGYLFALAMQLIEGSHHINPAILTMKQKKTVMKILECIHRCGVLHGDIATRNILFEPQSSQFYFIDFGNSIVVGTESPKLKKEKKELKRLLAY